jgi:hypothetical protein
MLLDYPETSPAFKRFLSGKYDISIMQLILLLVFVPNQTCNCLGNKFFAADYTRQGLKRGCRHETDFKKQERQWIIIVELTQLVGGWDTSVFLLNCVTTK